MYMHENFSIYSMVACPFVENQLIQITTHRDLLLGQHDHSQKRNSQNDVYQFITSQHYWASGISYNYCKTDNNLDFYWFVYIHCLPLLDFASFPLHVLVIQECTARLHKPGGSGEGAAFEHRPAVTWGMIQGKARCMYCVCVWGGVSLLRVHFFNNPKVSTSMQ